MQGLYNYFRCCVLMIKYLQEKGLEVYLLLAFLLLKFTDL